MKTIFCIAVAVILLIPFSLTAGGKGSGRSASPSIGTGSKSSSTRVGGYTKKDGTHVDTYRRSTPDTKFENNWSTKGNANPLTGKDGTRVTPPAK